MDPKGRFDTYLRILSDLGYEFLRDALVIDFGCGSGAMVRDCRDAGVNAYGCDVTLPDEPEVAALQARGILRSIDTDPYRLPFQDEEADLVVSDQVLEHVADLQTVFREIHRVLKPGGVMLHFFPPRYAPVEPHVFVPLATVVRSAWWLRLWASLGIRNSFQRGLSSAETARRNREFLTGCTFYRTKRQLRAEADSLFTDLAFCESLFLKHSRRGNIVFRLSSFLPFLPALYGFSGAVVLFALKPAIQRAELEKIIVEKGRTAR